MRIGIIDLGTNSVRFDVHQLGPGRKVKCLHREKIMVRLGQGIFLSGKLDRSACKRTLLAFQQFKRLSLQYRTKKVIAFGTSALREVADRDGFIETIRALTGISVRVISGVEEAKLIALGILSNEKKMPKGHYALVDIGGGSTEMSICRGKEILHCQSFPLGTARLQQLFLKKSPPSVAQIGELRHHIRSVIFETTLPEQWPVVDRVIGSSGTIRALQKIMKRHKDFEDIQRTPLVALVSQMSKMTTTELLNISGMESKRVDMILAGAVLFEESMVALGASRAVSTEFSLRDGILEEERSLYLQGGDSRLTLHKEDILEKAQVLGGNAAHLTRVSTFAEELFDRLKPLHRLEPSWRIYLSVAMILRDVGESVNQAKHSQHSYYIVKHSDLTSMDNWEREFIAELCLHHEGTKFESKQFGFKKSKLRRDAFLKLLAIIRVADALDPGPDVFIKIRKISIHKSTVNLDYSGKNLTGLEQLNSDRKSAFFEKVFGRKWIATKC